MNNKINKHKLPRLSMIAIALFGYSIIGHAENTDQLETINVTSNSELTTKPAVIKKTQTDIQNELIRDTRDLVRYTTDIGISDNGRNLRGFSMRGVEGNRVGISIDGVNLPDFEENSLYSRYGNFNSSRLSIDSELVQNIEIVRGSDSFNSGSGTLGGGVNYRTLEAQDIIKSGNNFGALLRGGYASKNDEWVRTFGTAYVGEKLDALLIYSQRTGHELESNGHGSNTRYSSSQHPDPSTHRFHSYLAKVGYQISPSHRIGFNLNGQKGNTYTDERSYTLLPSAWREADDEHKRMNTNIYYAYTPESAYLALLKADFDYQKTDLAAINYKGFTSYGTNIKNLDEIYNRRMKTKYHRVSLQIDSQPLTFLGEHNLSFKTSIAQRNFENINTDTLLVGTPRQTDLTYTIQYPIKTTLYSAALQDRIVWRPEHLLPMLTGIWGIRYDYEKLSPQTLNAECSKACTAEGKPKETGFSNWTNFIGIEAELNDIWTASYKLSTGYRTPTASEMYFTFTNAYGTWKSNPNLKPERSISHTLSLQAKHQKAELDISLHHTRYRHFLLEQENMIEQTDYGRTYLTPVQQMVNINRAKVSGIEIKGKMNVNTLLPVSDGWKVMGGLGYSKGKLSNGESLLSIQPIKVVIGLDYEQLDGKWGVFSRLTYLGGKKAGDAKISENNRICLKEGPNPWYDYYGFGDPTTCIQYGYEKEITTYKYLNKSAYVFDVFAFYKPTDNITLRAGIYNVFNREYHNWDALRGINAHSTSNSVDRAGVGLERFKAPGRNYALSMEVIF